MHPFPLLKILRTPLHSLNLTLLGFFKGLCLKQTLAMKPAIVAKLKTNTERKCNQVLREVLRDVFHFTYLGCVSGVWTRMDISLRINNYKTIKLCL